MSALFRLRAMIVLAATVGAALAVSPAAAQEEAAKQKVDVKGEYVRLGYNDEGWVVLGYGTANSSVGEEWMLLDVGITLVNGTPDQKLDRDDLTVTTPDGSTVQLASQEEFTKASLRALEARANMTRDSINYFPAIADKACRIGFFTDVSQPVRGLAYDVVELSHDRACVGRAYFKVPNGIQYGQHFLNVRFAGSTVQVPFKIMTKDELKENKAKWKELQKQLKQQQKDQG
ncbi:MAG TPA: hypothetical protein PLS95_01480 [Thermoanaerobaculales bacterium]|nr:hypothetical protein [Thermoanaerobaculales bacterium]HQN95113.1 hypothetical protein [Thermoanaerobaculales bacterium]HQP42730.1 hypothetical protein [Thermoanaerobaculales bacterium]